LVPVGWIGLVQIPVTRALPPASGLLAEEEERLYKLRVEKEAVAREQLFAERQKLEEEVKQTQVGSSDRSR
jgi:hypothetical protein